MRSGVLEGVIGLIGFWKIPTTDLSGNWRLRCQNFSVFLVRGAGPWFVLRLRVLRLRFLSLVSKSLYLKDLIGYVVRRSFTE